MIRPDSIEPRYGILGLMGAVLASAVAMYWLIHPTFHAASQAFTVALTVLLVATLLAVLSRRRTFWIGFCLFGWAYFALAFAPGSRAEVRPYLFTSHLLGDLMNMLGHKRDSPPKAGNFQGLRVAVPADSGLDVWFTSIEGERFQRVGHALASIAHAFVGGLLALFIANRLRAREASAIPVEGPTPAAGP